MIGYGMPYMNMSGNYMTELQNMRDRIDGQIQQIQQQQQNISQMPMQQPTNLTQNFQLAPNSITSNFKIVNNLEDVQKEIVIADTYFLNKDNSLMWIKNPKGDLKTFTLTEVIPKDNKDILIEKLQAQIQELQGGKANEYIKSNDDELHEQSDARDDGTIGKPIETSESSNVSIVPNSKTTKRRP